LTDSVTTILDKRGGSAPDIHGYSFALSYRRLILQLADGGANDGFTNYASIPIANLRDHNWHHVAVSVTRTIPNGIRWYHNGAMLPGQQVDPTDREGSLISDAPVRIGANTADQPLTNFFDGDMDELQIFNRALTGQEIASIYQAGASGQCKH
jgi:Concanavalin A-like lectin/glucanases superfamily